MLQNPPRSGPRGDRIVVETYKPFPKQQEFHRSPAKYRLFGGAAGPGKSLSLLWEAVVQGWEVPKVDTILLRRTFPELESSLLNYFRRDIPWRQIGATWNESKHVCVWPNGSTLRFGHCQRENDIYQYQGAEFLFIGLDELTTFTLKMWQFLTSRNRCPVPGTFPCMAGATNPGNIGHRWVKSLWVDKQAAPGMENPEKYNPGEYDFIKARIYDNPVYANDEKYLATLRALPTALRRAFLDGDWDVFAGQYFDVLDWSRHIVKNQMLDIPSWWPRWISMDWGFAHPGCVHWHAQDGDKTITYREEWHKGMSEKAWGELIVDRSAGEKIDAFYLGPDAFAKRTSSDTIAEQIGDVLARYKLPRPVLADNDRVGGWRLMYQMLEQGNWIISDSCRKLYESLPTLIRDAPDHIEDVLKVDESEGQTGDDAPDCARYGLKSRLSPRKMPQEEIDRTEASQITDPYAKHFFAAKRQQMRESRGVIIEPEYVDPWRSAE